MRRPVSTKKIINLLTIGLMVAFLAVSASYLISSLVQKKITELVGTEVSTQLTRVNGRVLGESIVALPAQASDSVSQTVSADPSPSLLNDLYDRFMNWLIPYYDTPIYPTADLPISPIGQADQTPPTVVKEVTPSVVAPPEIVAPRQSVVVSNDGVAVAPVVRPPLPATPPPAVNNPLAPVSNNSQSTVVAADFTKQLADVKAELINDFTIALNNHLMTSDHAPQIIYTTNNTSSLQTNGLISQVIDLSPNNSNQVNIGGLVTASNGLNVRGGSLTAGTNGEFTVDTSGNITTSGIITTSGDLTSATLLSAPYFTATSATATSTFAGGMSVAGTSGLTVLQNGMVGIGTASPKAVLNTVFNGGNSELRVKIGDSNDDPMFGGDTLLSIINSGETGTHWTDMAAVNYKNGQNGFPNLGLYNAGGTASSPLTLGNSQIVGQVLFRGYNSSFKDVGMISVTTDSNFTSTNYGKMAFQVGLTDKMTILSSGNVGIGTTVPEDNLDVANSAANSGIRTTSYSNNAAGAGFLILGRSRSATIGTYTVTQAGDRLGQIAFNGVNSSNAPATAAFIRSYQDGAAGVTNISGHLELFTSNSAGLAERMRIDKAGLVGIGTTSPSQMLSVNGSGLFNGNISAANITATGTVTSATLNNSGTITTSNLNLTGITNGGGQCLQINSAGVVSGTGALCGGSGSVPAGVLGNIQFNNGGLWGGSSNLFWDANNNRLGVGTVTPASPLDVTNNALGATANAFSGIYLNNSTAAAASAQQQSPSIHWSGQAWKSTAPAASQSVDFISYVLPVQGTSAPTANWILASAINGSAYTSRLTLTSAGALAVTGALTGATTGAFSTSVTTPLIINTGATVALFNTATAAQTINIGNGVNATGVTKTINIGNLGAAGSITNTTIGSSVSTATLNLGTGVTASGKTNTVNIGTAGAAGSVTDITIGSTLGTSITSFNGNVGIGTTAPASPLDVNGNINTSGLYLGDGGASGIKIISSGNVGIGTTSPSDTLAVNGSVYLANVSPANTSNRLYANSDSLYWSGNLISGASAGNWTTDGTNAWRATGNVGIGTSSPWTTLAVNGSSDLGNFAMAGYFIATSTTATSTFSGGLTSALFSGDIMSTNMTASGLASLYNLNVSNIATAATLNITGTASTSALVISGISNGQAQCLQINSRGEVSGSGLACSGLGSGSATVPQGNTGALQFNNGGLLGGANNLAWDNINNILSVTGNVGIGTTSPQATLGMQGSLGVNSSQLYLAANGKVGIGTTEPTLKLDVLNNLTDITGSGGIQSIVNSTITTSGSFRNDAMAVMAKTNIGTGITNSNALVGIFAESFRNLLGTGDNGSLGSLYGERVLYGHYDNDPAATPITTTAYGLLIGSHVKTGTITNMYDLFLAQTSTGGAVTNHYGVYQVDSNVKNYFAGNVGIGTTSPWGKLSVTQTGTDGAPSFIVEDSASPDTTPFIIDQTGNVGIGTTSPSQALSVQGNGLFSGSLNTNSLILSGLVSAGAQCLQVDANGNVTGTSVACGGSGSVPAGVTGNLQFNNGGVFAASSTLTWNDTLGYLGIGTTTPNANLGLQGSIGVNGTQLYLAANGNVGIGTASPLLKLSVMGSSRFTGSPTSVLTGSIDPAASATVTGVGTLFLSELVVGDRITVTGVTKTVTAIASDTSLTVDTAFSNIANDTSPDKLAAIFIARNSSNAESMVINDLGNVGIGTANPGARLQVASAGDTVTSYTARFQSSGSIAGAGGILFDQNNTNSYKLHTEGTGATSGLLKFSYITQATGAVLNDNILVLKSGNVGIATTTPTQPLTVEGNALVSGDLYLPSLAIAGVGQYLQINSAGQVFGTGNIATTSPPVPIGPINSVQFNNGGLMAGASALIYDANNSRVGIGTTSPYATLSVVGDSALGNSALAGYFMATSTSIASIFPYASSTALTVSGTADFGNLIVSNTANLASVTASGNLTVAGIASSSNLIISGITNGAGQCLQIDASGNVTGSGVACGGAGASPVGALNSVQFNNGGNFGGASNLFWDETNGRLGIGTTSPATTLDINGTNSGLTNTRFSTSLGSALLLQRSNNATVGTNTLITNADEEIGKIFFNAANGDGSFTSVARIVAFTGAGGHTSSSNMPAYLSFNTTAVNSAQSHERMRISESGNVGIGTTNPGAKLDVNGTARATMFYIPNSSTGATVGFTNPYINDNFASLAIQPVEANKNVALRIEPKGISSDPNIAGLQVNGTDYTADPANYNFLNVKMTNSAAQIQVGKRGTATSYPLVFGYDYGAGIVDVLTISTTGNVGIGTASPTQKLEVSGNALFSGIATSSTLVATTQVITPNLTISGITNGAGQCLQVNADGLVSGTGLPCGSASGSGAVPAGADGAIQFNSGGVYGGSTNLSWDNTNNRLNFGANADVSIYQNGSPLLTSFTTLFNTSVGYQALASNTTGNRNTATGNLSLFANTEGSNNTAYGYRSLVANTTGSYNTAAGVYSLVSNTTGEKNTATGYFSLGINSTGSYNTANGYISLKQNTTGNRNTANGVQSLISNTTGSYNTANGMNSLYNNGSATSTTAIGYAAGFGVSGQTYSQNNVFLGYMSGYGNTTGNNNTLLGYQTGYDLTTGGNNTIIGYFPTTAVGLTTGSDNILIGDDVRAGLSRTGGNQLNIGNLIFGTGVNTGTTFSTGFVGIGTSSPQGLLDVFGNSAGIDLTVFDGTRALSIINSNTTDGNANGLDFRTNDLAGTVVTGAKILGVYNDHTTGAVSADLAFMNRNEGTVQENMRLTSAGNLGIGTSSPTANLDIYSNAPAPTDLMFKISSSTGIALTIQADGTVYSDSAYNSTGADYAEYFKTNNPDLTAGEIVCVDLTETNAVKRCERGHDNNVMGIVSTKPSIVGNAQAQVYNNPNYVIIGMLGQVDALVSAENGAINIGDSLTSASSTPGYAMKADGGDSTVSVALEPLLSGTGKIKVLISRRNKSLAVEEVEALVVERIANMKIEDQVQLLIKQSVDNLNLDPKITKIAQEESGKLNTALTVRLDDVNGVITNLRTQVLAGMTELNNQISSLGARVDDLSATALMENTRIDENGDLVIGLGTNSIAEPDKASVLNVSENGRVTIVGELLVDGRIMVCSGGTCSAALDNAVDQTMGDMGVEGKVVAGAFEGYCDDGYVWVPGSAKYGTLPGFCVMSDLAGSAGVPQVNLNQGEANAACQVLGTDYHLISENEWLTIAENILRVAANATDATSTSFKLTNDNVINNLAGSTAEWTNEAVNLSDLPVLSGDGWQEYSNVLSYKSLSSIRPPYYLTDEKNHIGQIITGDGLEAVRGYVRGAKGIYSLDLTHAPDEKLAEVGFRCAK